MSTRVTDGRVENAAVALEALAGAGLALFVFDDQTGCLRIDGDASAFGFANARTPLTLAAFSKLITPDDIERLSELLEAATPGAPVEFDLTALNGTTGVWRGARSGDGRSAAGVILPTTGKTSVRDPLTGLLTRSAFLAALDQRLAIGMDQRLLVVDLARMRRLNEALGFARADQVLGVLGARLAAHFELDSLAARVGDNAFALMVSTYDDNPLAGLKALLEQPMTIDGVNIHPTVAVADARMKASEAVSADELLRRAEVALGAVKAANRAKLAAGAAVEPASDGQAVDSLARLTLESELRGAVARGEIEPYYQPIIRLSDGHLAGFEALVRWRHPRRGLLPPDDFLPLVNETGLMAEVGLFMARAAVNQIVAWRKGRHSARDIFVSVNLTTGDLERATLAAEVADILAGANLPAGSLKLEITESEVMRDPDRAAALLYELKAIGAALSLDDFGMGFSSLSWLSRLPIQGLKIDRYFIRTMDANEGSHKIVRSIVNLARDFGLDVVAEGVESRAMANALFEIGCQFGQGFGYAPPMPAEEALVYLIESEIDGAPI